MSDSTIGASAINESWLQDRPSSESYRQKAGIAANQFAHMVMGASGEFEIIDKVEKISRVTPFYAVKDKIIANKETKELMSSWEKSISEVGSDAFSKEIIFVDGKDVLLSEIDLSDASQVMQASMVCTKFMEDNCEEIAGVNGFDKLSKDQGNTLLANYQQLNEMYDKNISDIDKTILKLQEKIKTENLSPNTIDSINKKIKSLETTKRMIKEGKSHVESVLAFNPENMAFRGNYDSAMTELTKKMQTLQDLKVTSASDNVIEQYEEMTVNIKGISDSAKGLASNEQLKKIRELKIKLDKHADRLAAPKRSLKSMGISMAMQTLGQTEDNEVYQKAYGKYNTARRFKTNFKKAKKSFEELQRRRPITEHAHDVRKANRAQRTLDRKTKQYNKLLDKQTKLQGKLSKTTGKKVVRLTKNVSKIGTKVGASGAKVAAASQSAAAASTAAAGSAGASAAASAGTAAGGAAAGTGIVVAGIVILIILAIIFVIALFAGTIIVAGSTIGTIFDFGAPAHPKLQTYSMVDVNDYINEKYGIDDVYRKLTIYDNHMVAIRDIYYDGYRHGYEDAEYEYPEIGEYITPEDWDKLSDELKEQISPIPIDLREDIAMYDLYGTPLKIYDIHTLKDYFIATKIPLINSNGVKTPDYSNYSAEKVSLGEFGVLYYPSRYISKDISMMVLCQLFNDIETKKAEEYPEDYEQTLTDAAINIYKKAIYQKVVSVTDLADAVCPDKKCSQGTYYCTDEYFYSQLEEYNQGLLSHVRVDTESILEEFNDGTRQCSNCEEYEVEDEDGNKVTMYRCLGHEYHLCSGHYAVYIDVIMSDLKTEGYNLYEINNILGKPLNNIGDEYDEETCKEYEELLEYFGYMFETHEYGGFVKKED